MKRKGQLLCSLVLAGVLLTGCGAQSANDTTKDVSAKQETSTKVDKAEQVTSPIPAEAAEKDLASEDYLAHATAIYEAVKKEMEAKPDGDTRQIYLDTVKQFQNSKDWVAYEVYMAATEKFAKDLGLTLEKPADASQSKEIAEKVHSQYPQATALVLSHEKLETLQGKDGINLIFYTDGNVTVQS